MGEPLIKGIRAGAAIARNTLVAFNDAGEVVAASSGADRIAGVSCEVDCAAGRLCDVVLSGLFEVRAGAAIAAGDLLTSDAQGRAVPLPSGNAKKRIAGLALGPAAENEFVLAAIAPGLA